MFELIKSIPRVENDLEFHLSLSQLSTFLNCGFQYAHRYVWNTPMESRTVDEILEYAIQRAAEAFHFNQMKTGEPFPFGELQKVFESSLRQECERNETLLTDEDSETYEAIRNRGIELLWLIRAAKVSHNIIDVEYPFAVEIPDLVHGGVLPIRLAGVMGLIERDQNGNYRACQIKIVPRLSPNTVPDYTLESSVLSYALSQLKPSPSGQPAQVRFDLLCYEGEPSIEHIPVVVSPAEHQRLIYLVNEVLRAINQRIFYRRQGRQCLTCPFKTACLPE